MNIYGPAIYVKWNCGLIEDPDTIRNVVLNPRNEKPAFREESRKSISYLERGDEKKGKSRGKARRETRG